MPNAAPGSAIEIGFVNTLADHIHAARLYDSKQNIARMNKVVAAVLLAAAAYFTWQLGLGWWSVFAVLAPLEWFDLLSLRPLQTRIFFKRNPKFREEYHLTFTEESIHFCTATIDSDIAWSFYNRVIESARVFLLVYGRGAYAVIPKSAFSSEDDIRSFRELLTSKVPT